MRGEDGISATTTDAPIHMQTCSEYEFGNESHSPSDFRTLWARKADIEASDGSSEAAVIPLPSMGFITGFLTGLLSVPALLTILLLHAYFTFPLRDESSEESEDHTDALKRPSDDKDALKTSTDELAAKFQRKYESDVAAGYYAVCREYVPGGVNGKPPERTTPAGEVVAMESPSVYQSMYRSIFDRKEKPTLEPNKGNGKSVKRANNVFFVVLRHGHLMLYDDEQQIDVRYVIPLEHHEVSLYNGSNEAIPEGELWIKRNAICLRRRFISAGDMGTTSMPFFFFSENTSNKEDFYFAMLKNQEKLPSIEERPPRAQQFDVKHIIGLVQVLHSSEEQLQTRWFNAMISRLFLAIYQTSEIDNFLRTKISKKISRVKRPNFITRIALQKIDTGEGAPYITNPRLKDLTVSGECCMEADVKYTGKFRLEIAATARIDLGSRFKAREVDLVLAVVVNKVEGHMLLKFKPPPSNRVWFTFDAMPRIDMTIEPIVSSRQITYKIILQQIESRIREVVAETLVLPFWDDVPFLDTAGQKYRGGIWIRETKAPKPVEIKQEDVEDDIQTADHADDLHSSSLEERTLSMPTLPVPQPEILKARGSNKTPTTPVTDSNTASTTSIDRTSKPATPKAMRSNSFASAANPMVTTNHASVQPIHHGLDLTPRKDAASAMIEISNKSVPSSPTETPTLPLAEPYPLPDTKGENGDQESSDPPSSRNSEAHSHKASESSMALERSISSSMPPSPVISSFDSEVTPRENHQPSSESPRLTTSLSSTDRKQTFGSLGSATAAAKKWGWNMISRNEQKLTTEDPGARPGTPDRPIGRGRPLPPPGVPLPPPARAGLKFAPSLPKRKPIPPPTLPERPNGSNNKPPPLPKRSQRRTPSTGQDEASVEEVLVVEAPHESAPSSPTAEERQEEILGHETKTTET